MYEVQWEGYENGKFVKHKHGRFKTLEEAQKSVTKWWKQHKFVPPYIRESSYDDGTVWWDYGSHTCFYYFIRVDKDEC